MACEEDLGPPPPEKELHHTPPDNEPRGMLHYGSLDYLFWWFKSQPVPPLVTTGTNGKLSDPNTRVLLGDHLSFDDQEHMGVRGNFGWWLTPHQELGIEFGGFWLAQTNPSLTLGGPVLARPFVNATTGLEDAFLLASPGVTTGAIRVSALSRFWGAESNLRCEVCRCDCFHLDLLAGFRYLELDEALHIDSVSTVAATVPVFGGTSVFAADRFGTQNQFYGGQLGAEAEFHWGRFFLDLSAKVALGDMVEQVNTGGTTLVVTPSGTRMSLLGGFLALPTNIGHFHQDSFTAIPELGFNIGCQLTHHLRAYVGYTFLYVSDVVRPGDQIDRTVNTTQLPTLAGAGMLVGVPRPMPVNREGDFWAQGINVGFELRY
jgi:hypothetical protein